MLLIGIVVSFIVALGVVEWFLHWVRKHGFTVFAIYRILLGSRAADLGREADRAKLRPGHLIACEPAQISFPADPKG